MRKLRVRIDEIASAMEDHTGETEYYLDTKTGEVVVLSTSFDIDDDEFDDAGLADQDPYGDEDEASGAVDPAIEQSGGFHYPSRREVEADPDRYRPIPEISSREVYNLMVEFAESVSDPVLRRMLEVALNGRGAFRRFKDVLLDFPEERQRWFAMKNAFFEQEVRDWLESIGIEPAANA